MQILTVTNLPIYLPYDKAPVPFGDVFDDASSTNASPAVWTAAGLNPAVNDTIAFSVGPSGSLDANFTVGTKYYVKVVNADGTFTVSATKGGAAINAAAATSTTIIVHPISNQVDGTTAPFKSGATAVAMHIPTVGTISASLSPAIVAANTTAEQLFTFTGVAVGDQVSVTKPSAQAGLGIVNVRVSAANQVGITFMNDTGAGITPTASETYILEFTRNISSLILQGASDTGTVSGDVKGPGSWSTIATLPAGSVALVQLGYDWIRVNVAGSLVLLQN